MDVKRLPTPFLVLGLGVTLMAQSRFTLNLPAIADRLVQQLALGKGERVLIVAHPGVFEELIPHVRYAVMRAGGVDLGVLDVLREPVPDAWDPAVLRRAAPRPAPR